MLLTKKEWVLLLGIAIIFMGLRLPAIHSPYHQDEYKWVQYSHPEIVPPGTVPHPPLTEFIYTRIGPLVGDNNFRVIPLAFSAANILLIFYLSRIIFDKRSALWASLLFAATFYSVLASVMVDVDGAVMPMFFLLMSIGYYRLKISNFEFRISSLLLLLAGAIGGFLIKVIFVLPIAALALDFAIEKGIFSDKKRLLKYTGFGLLGVAGLILVLILSKFIFPFFNLSYALKYWQHFAVFQDRGWLQTFIQFAKAIMYASPLLLLPAIFSDKEIFVKARPLFMYIFLGLFFYLFAFDFSLGALDRYFQFLVVPLSIISGAVLAKYFGEGSERVCKPDIFAVSIISLGILALQFFEQAVPPLYPKTEWLGRIASFKWGFLFPFTGGSGPIPFYVSFQFIFLLWIVSMVFVALALWNRQVVKRSLFAVLVFGMVYNLVFAEEYLLGKVNGSSARLVQEASSYIQAKEDIKSVAVYNDNGGYIIKQQGKYARRIYAAPQFEETYTKFFGDFSGHIMYVNAPRVPEGSFYDKYFDSCKVMFEEKDRYITSQVLDCAK